MSNRYGVVLLIAVFVTLFGGGLLRSWARRGPLARAGRNLDLRQVGGFVMAAAVLVAGLAAPHYGGRYRAILACAFVLAVVGLLDDLQLVPIIVRRVVPVATAGVAVAVGIKIPITGSPVGDAVITMAWFVGAGAAVDRLGNGESLIPLVVGSSASALFGLAAFAGQFQLATIALAMAGSCVAFLAYNARPASLFVGRSGGLPLGFLLAVGAVWVNPALSPPGSLVVLPMLLLVPIVNGSLVVVRRARRQAKLTARRTDHLAHRLRDRGWTRGQVLALLAGLSIFASLLALFTGRGVLAFGIGAALIGAAMASLPALAGFRSASTAPGFSPRARVAIGAGVLLLIALCVPGILAAFDAKHSFDDANESVQLGLAAARTGDSVSALTSFKQARVAFADARKRLGNPVSSLSLVVPMVGSNLRAALDVAKVGEELSLAGERVARHIDPQLFRFQNGALPVDQVRALLPTLEYADRVLKRATREVRRLERAYLLAPIKDGLAQVNDQLTGSTREATNAALTARLAPAILGADGGPRRYFLMVQNPAELRGTGGLVGNWGLLTFDNGKLSLSRFERINSLNSAGPEVKALEPPASYERRYARFGPGEFLQNLNMSPDLPTVAALINQVLPQAGIPAVDGVLAVDPVGLAALLRLTGSVSVPAWPEPISDVNVVAITLNTAEIAFADRSERVDFLGDIAREVIAKATSRDLGVPAKIAQELGGAAHEGHISLSFSRPEEQRLARRLEIANDVRPTKGDSLFVVNQNSAANKIDYYLHRSIGYQVELDPASSGRRATVRSHAELTLRNDAPKTGAPRTIIGPSESAPGTLPGQNVSFTSMYSRLQWSGAQLDGKKLPGLEVDRELGQNVYSTFLNLPSGSVTTLGVDLGGIVKLDHGRWYTLRLQRQPTLYADDFRIDLSLPDGWRISDLKAPVGVSVVTDRTVSGAFLLSRTTTIRVRVSPAAGLGLFTRLDLGP